MGLMDLFNQGDIRDKLYAAASKNNVPQGGVTGAMFKGMFPHGLGNLAFGRQPEPMPPLDSPEGTAYMADLASNMAVPGTFIGPKGMSNLFGDDVARGLLSSAEAKLAQGVPKETVFSELGVFRGPEGKWRYEIDDSGANMPYQPNRHARTDMMLTHPELYAAYPEAAHIPMTVTEDMKPGSGQFSDEGILISRDGGGQQSIALHELQHAIQGQEDFARGGSTSVMEWGKPAYRKELLKMAEEIMNQPPASYQRYWGKEVTPEGEAAYAEYLKHFHSKENQKQMWAAAQQGAPSRAYQRLAGEAESRAVQDRMNMNMDQRRSIFPDYANRSDLIIRGLMSGGK